MDRLVNRKVKLNRLIRMSEAINGVCDLVDEGKLSISTAAEMSALKPKTQESVLHLLDLGYKTTLPSATENLQRTSTSWKLTL